MTTFIGSVYKLISIPIQGIWNTPDGKITYAFQLKDSKNPTPDNPLDLVLSIDGEEQGVVKFEFNPEGKTAILVNGGKAFDLYSMYIDPVRKKYILHLVKTDGKSIVFQKQE